MRTLWKVLYKLSPARCEELQTWLALDFAARRLSRQLGETPALGAKASRVVADRDFGAVQRVPEIEALLETLALRRPRAVCEIGGANGGTLALFCQLASDDAILISIDLAYTWPRRRAHRRFARADQQVHSLRADSHRPSTVSEVRRLLRGRRLDLLLIDGDHSLDGVRRDFEMFGPLLNERGIIAFHDIVPDHASRHGIRTDSVAGGVPQFWETLRNKAGARELIESPDQDGYGIGLLEVGTSVG